MDEDTRYKWSRFLKENGEVSETIKQVILEIQEEGKIHCKKLSVFCL